MSPGSGASPGTISAFQLPAMACGGHFRSSLSPGVWASVAYTTVTPARRAAASRRPSGAARPASHRTAGPPGTPRRGEQAAQRCDETLGALLVVGAAGIGDHATGIDEIVRHVDYDHGAVLEIAALRKHRMLPLL